MDYDNDGTLDLISGSYDPGDVYLFLGLGKGKYAKRETIVDENEVPLVHHPIEMAKYSQLKPDDWSDEATQLRVASFGSWVAAADWDADKDLDMLIGSFGGGLFLRENIGTRAKPKYSSGSKKIEANGKPLVVDSHAAPVVADWDGDGKFDLVIGSGDGSVGWYKNIGSVSEPKFGERRLLVSPAYTRSSVKQPADEDPQGAIFIRQVLQPGETPIPGARAQICIHDYNRDGRLDLIVGDYSEIDWARELSEAEKDERHSIAQEMKDLGNKLNPIQEKLYGDGSKTLGATEKAELEKKYQSIISKFTELDGKRKSFFAESRSASFVWLYLRKPEAGRKVATTEAPES